MIVILSIGFKITLHDTHVHATHFTDAITKVLKISCKYRVFYNRPAGSLSTVYVHL